MKAIALKAEGCSLLPRRGRLKAETFTISHFILHTSHFLLHTSHFILPSMSSASSGRYQSRLFNFVHQQSRQVKQQCDRAFRTLQLNISWVAAVGLHPLLQMFQSTRAAKQLHQTVQQSFPVLSPCLLYTSPSPRDS